MSIRTTLAPWVLLLFIALPMSVIAEEGPEAIGKHRFGLQYRGRTLDVRLESGRVAIQLRDDGGGSTGGAFEFPGALGERLSADPTFDLESAPVAARAGLWFLALRDASTEAEIDAALERLELEDAIQFAAPVLRYRGTTLLPTDQLIITIERENASGTIDELLTAPDLEWIREIPGRDPMHLVRVSGRVADVFVRARELSALPGVIAADPDLIEFHTLRAIPNDTFFDSQWAHRNLGQIGTLGSDAKTSSAWNVETGSATITVAVIDSGVEVGHPDLSAQIVAGHDSTNLPSPGGIPGNAGLDAHGTACAGIVGASGNNGIGISGTCWNVSIQPVRIFDDAGLTQTSWLTDGITWAVDNGADILSNSWGGGAPSIAVENSLQYALDVGRGGLGSPVFFASGNDNAAVDHPAAFPQAIAIGATSPCDERTTPISCDGEDWWGSNFGAELDIVAPGVLITTTDLTGPGGYATGDYLGNFNGTSSATPLVAGAAALLLSADPNLTAGQVRTFLRNGADDQVGLPSQDVAGFDNHMGHGRLNIANTIALLGGPAAPSSVGCSESGPAEVTLSWTNNSAYDSIEIFEGPSLVQTLAGSATSSIISGVATTLAQFEVRGVVAGSPTISAPCSVLLLAGATELVWSPVSGTVDGGAGLADALLANGRDVILTQNLGLIPDLDVFERVWVNLGVFPSTAVLGVAEGNRLVTYLTNGVGGSFLYLEGADTWFFDPPTPVHPLFELTSISDGVNGADLTSVLGTGVGGCDLTGLNLVYTGENNWIDRLTPTGSAITIQSNSAPAYDVAIFNDAGSFRTIGASFELAGFFDGLSTRADLVAAYLGCSGSGFVPPVSFLGCGTAGADVSLGWSNPGGYDSIEIDRDGVTIAVLAGNAIGFDDLGLPPETYLYAVRGIAGGVPSLDELCSVDVLPPPISGLTCALVGEDADLSWIAPAAASGITVRRDGSVLATLPGTAVGFTDVAPTGGPHSYEVVSTAAGLDSSVASCSLAVTPNPITSLDCTSIVGFIQLTWVLGEGYDEIEITRDGTSLAIIGGGITSHLDQSVAAGAHDYTVTPRIGGVSGSAVSCSATLAPSPVSGIACAGGALSATITWNLGDSYDELELRRNGVAIQTLPGTATSVIDTTPTVGSHLYGVVGRTGGVDASVSSCAASVVPTSVSLLTCVGGAGSVALSWVNGMAYSTIEIGRDGALIDVLLGSATIYTDPNAPLGNVSYTVLGRVAGVGSAETPCSTSVVLPPIGNLSCGTLGSTVALSWTLGGSYSAIELRRDGVLITTLGGTALGATDATAQGGTHLYSVTPLLGGVAAVPTECIGAVEPAAVTDLSTAITDPCLCLGNLSWSNAEVYDALEVRLDGVLIANLPGTDTALSVTLPTNGSFTLCVRPVIDAIEGLDVCAPLACDPVPADSIGSLDCLVDGPTCTATVTWAAHPTAASFEVRLDGALVSTLPGTATLATVPLLGPGVATIEVSGTNSCAAPLPVSTCLVDCLPPVQFVRGDANGDGNLDVSDPITTLIFLFQGGAVGCVLALDTNDDNAVDLSDAISALEAAFGVSGLPGAPFPTCGDDPTPGTLDCASFTLCP